MDREQAQQYMEEAAQRGIVPGLSATKALLRALGNPERALRFLHIAGTNGKGSVLAYLSTVLQEAGCRVGRFYSPALLDPWDKIQVNRRRISEKEVCRGLELLRESGAEGTVFEIECALALWYFARKRCDIVILECGLGGAEDATNVIPAPELCIFTPISYDHTGILGNSLREIAAAKAGILKPGSAAVSAPQEREAAEVLRGRAAELGIPLTESGAAERISYGLYEQSFDYAGYEGLRIRLAGSWQIENAVLAVEALRQLRERGVVDVPETALREGLYRTVWDGRLTVLAKRPLFLIDGAHNEAAARELRRSLELYLPEEPLVVILGVLRDKPYPEILRQLSGRIRHLITLTPPENARALPALTLAEEARELLMEREMEGTEAAKRSITAADSVEEAVEIAYLLSGGRMPILATGSLSWIGRVRGLLRHRSRAIRV